MQEGCDDARKLNAGALAASMAMAVIALLVGLHSAGRASAFFAASPPFPEAPPDQAGIERELDAAKRAASRAPDDAVFRERIGSLLLARAEAFHAAGDETAAALDWRASSSELLAALELNPASPAAHWQRIVALERLGLRDDASALARRAARALPAFPRLQFYVGKYFMERHVLRTGVEGGSEYARMAIEAFRNAASADPALLDQSLEFISSKAAGIVDLDSIVPPTHESRSRYSRFLARKGEWERVARIEEEFIAAGRDDADTRLRAGEARVMKGDVDAAFEHYEAAVRGWILGDSQITAIGSAFSRARRTEDGLRFFMMVDHILDPEEVLPAAMAKGRMHYDLGHLADAEENLTKAALEGANPDAYFYLSLLSEKIGDFYSAETHLKQAIRSRRDQAKYHYRLGTIYEKMKRIPDALRELKTASAMEPRNEAYRLEAARLDKIWREGK